MVLEDTFLGELNHPVQVHAKFELERTLNGKFQGANRIDYSDATSLYIITHEATMNIYTVNINDPKQYKYLRYLSGINGSCNMAEIEFYIEDSILSLSGKVIGTDGSFQNDPTRTKFAVFDGDPLTFYDAIEPNGAWAGIELDKPQRIDKLVYQFRNDDNGIRKGDLYELMYWNNDNKWKSCGKIIAKENELIYNDIPPGTLYWLRNHTRGKEERIFTYNTNQVWW